MTVAEPNGPPSYLDGMPDGFCHGDAGRLPDQGRLAQPGFHVAAGHCGRVAGRVDAHRQQGQPSYLPTGGDIARV